MTYEPITRNQAIGSAIVWARYVRGQMTQQQLVDAIEIISKRTLGAIEHGQRKLYEGERIAIAHVLNMPMDWLANPPLPETVELVDAATVGGSSGP